jgi:hypothetical protein
MLVNEVKLPFVVVKGCEEIVRQIEPEEDRDQSVAGVENDFH